MAKVTFDKKFFDEFRQDPKKTFSKYGINFSEGDTNFFSQDFQHMSFDEFKSRLEKSRFFGFFDFSA